MNSNRKWRLFFIAILAAALIFIAAVMTMRENKMCLGAEVVPAQYLQGRQEINVDLKDYIFFEDEKAAVDGDERIIYIPNQIDEKTKPKDLKGKLSIALGEYELKFIRCDEMENLQQAVRDNRTFTLVAVGPQGYVKYDVIFSTLPVINITSGEFIHMKNNREVWDGNMTVWAPYDESAGDFSTKTGRIKYNYRGGTTYFAAKKSYRISFIGGEGDKRNVNLLNLGEDDDWILNGMTMDDMRVKEKVCMSLWNQHAQTTDYNYKMSQGEYAEVIADGKYRGLYMLQRRVDPKYLGLSDDDILFKRSNVMTYETAEEGYEIKNTPLTESETYAILNDVFYNGNLGIIDPDNLADTNLFMEMGYMADNVQKNIYFVLRDTGDNYQLRFILWDTDMTFGIVWSPEGFIYNAQKALKGASKRPETKPYAEINPQIYDLMAQKWAVLRSTVLTEENILAELDEAYNQIVDSGAYDREVDKWQCNAYGGKDTKDNMESFIRQKLQIMDEKYLQQ